MILQRMDVRLSIRLSKSVVYSMLKEDKINFLHQQASKAAQAYENGDFKKSFDIVESLKGNAKRPIRQVKLKNGSLSTSEVERQQRWEEYFTELFGGDLHTDTSSLSKQSVAPLREHITLTYKETDQSIRCLGHYATSSHCSLHCAFDSEGTVRRFQRRWD